MGKGTALSSLEGASGWKKADLVRPPTHRHLTHPTCVRGQLPPHKCLPPILRTVNLLGQSLEHRIQQRSGEQSSEASQEVRAQS